MDGATRGQAVRPIKRGRGGAVSSSAAFGRKLAGAAGLFKPAEHDEGSEGDTSDGGDAGNRAMSAKRLGKRPAAAASSSRNEEISFSRDGSVVDGDAEAARKSRFEVTVTENRYQALKPHREKERRDAIAAGLIPDPLKPVRLDEAITFHGTCQDMCPEFEREEREFQKNVDKWELRPGTSRIDPKRAVKAFHRPAAGNEQPLPSDVRPPKVLKRTLDYLFHTILSEDPQMMDSHPFLRDRTRAIRQDFTMQNDRSALAVECHERIARYHILCLHKLREWDSFSESQELEQLRKVLQSLIEFYDDARMEGQDCEHEAEFRAYYLLTHLRDSDTIRQIEALPVHVFDNAHVQAAITLHALAQRNNETRGERGRRPANSEASLNAFSRFFKAVASSQTSYLLACLAESHFFDIRRGALIALRKAFIPQHPQFPLSRLGAMLGCDGVEHCAELVDNFGLAITNNAAGVPVSVELHRGVNLIEYPSLIKQKASETIVEAKRGSATVQSVIDGEFYSAQIPASSTQTIKRPRPVLQQTSTPAQRKPSPLSATMPSVKAISPIAKLSAAAATFTPRTATSPVVPAKLPTSHSKPPSPAVERIVPSAFAPLPSSKPKSPLQAIHQRQSSFAEAANSATVVQPTAKSPTMSLSTLKRKPVSKSEVLDGLWQILAREAVNGFTTQAATSALADYHNRDFADHDAERQTYLQSIVDQLRERLIEDCANQASNDIVVDHFGRRTECRRSLHHWHNRLQQRRQARERLRMRKHRFSEIVGQLPSSPTKSSFSAAPYEDLPDISMLVITRDARDSPIIPPPAILTKPVTNAFWQSNTLADLINQHVNAAFDLRASSAQPADWVCVVELDDLDSSIATWWRTKLGMRPDEDQILHVLSNVRARYELVTVGALHAVSEAAHIGLLLSSSSESSDPRDLSRHETLLRKSQYEVSVVTCVWKGQAVTEGNAVNIDTTDCNGGLGKTLAVRLRIVRFSRSPRASKLQSLVSDLRSELEKAMRTALAALADMKEDELCLATSTTVDLVAHADRLVDQICASASGSSATLSALVINSEDTLHSSLLRYLTQPILAGSPVISSASLYLAGQTITTSATVQLVISSVVEACSERWSRRSLSESTSEAQIDVFKEDFTANVVNQLEHLQTRLSVMRLKSPAKKRRRESGQLDETPKKQKASSSPSAITKVNNLVSHASPTPVPWTSPHVAKLSALIKETRTLLCK